MYDTFESQKNTKALSYTMAICGFLLLIFIFYKWPLQIPVTPVAQDLIEVNLGNEHEGLGNVQPLVKGEPAQQNAIPRQKESKSIASSQQDIKADEDKNQEAATVTKEVKIKKESSSIQPTTEKNKLTAVTPATEKSPAPPKLKVPLYKRGNGSGGNGAQQDNGFRNEGYKSGNGDAGSPGGKPDSYGNSPGGRSGVSVIRGLSGRRPIHFPSMQDDFNETAKIYVDITVDASGSVTSSSIARGSTTSNGTLINIALQKAKQLKFPASTNDTERGTILFNFILKN